jgi:hypothetical protein
LFVKRGVIKIAVDAEGQALDTRVDEITLIGLDSGATDFEPNISGDSAEIEVCEPGCSWRIADDIFSTSSPACPKI